MAANTDFLQTTLPSIFQNISPQCASNTTFKLLPYFRQQAIKRNQPIVRQGELWLDLLVIENGLIRMHFLRQDGREFNKNFFHENQLLCPLTTAMWSEPSLFGITAIENTLLWRCPIATVIEQLPTSEWLSIQRELLSRLLNGKLQREHDLLALNGRQRYEKFCTSQPKLAERVPLLHLATYLGMTDVSLSRLRSKN